jgi:small subunit ribosomal protein S4
MRHDRLANGYVPDFDLDAEVRRQAELYVASIADALRDGTVEVKADEKARRTAGVTGDNLIGLLELRLDNVAFRLGFAETRAQARQLVSHGFFDVNGKKVNVPSFHVKVGDQLSVRPLKQKSKYMELLREKLKSYRPQEWVESDAQKLAGKVLTQPTPDLVSNQINTQLIVEHYSR